MSFRLYDTTRLSWIRNRTLITVTQQDSLPYTFSVLLYFHIKAKFP